jgi:hypothetical protein
LVQELEYETNIKRLGYLSLLYTETIISVLIFIILQQLIEVGAFASISTVFFKTSGVRGRSQTLCISPIALWAERGKFFLAFYSPNSFPLSAQRAIGKKQRV